MSRTLNLKRTSEYDARLIFEKYGVSKLEGEDNRGKSANTITIIVVVIIIVHYQYEI